MSVNDQILDAIELLAKTSVERAGYDKTIQAQIISCQDKTSGKYKCKYQDAIFYAYTGNSDMSLSKGTMVYVLVPQNDMSKDKTIIGIVDKLGVDFVTIAEGEDAYEKVGVNVISSGGPFYLDTNNIDYNYTNILNHINLDTNELKKYVNKSSFLVIAATIQTQFPLNKQPQAGSEYGIKFTVTFSDNSSKDYELDNNSMVGMPFKLVSPTRQVVILPIDGENFTSISGISIYNSGFINAQGTESGDNLLNSGDIIISNLEIYGANRLSQEQLNGVMISLYTPDGSVFTSPNTKKRIMAQIKVKGQVVSSEGISFYWGLEDMNITSSHSKFNQYLGYGWSHITSTHQIGWNPESDYMVLQDSDIRCSKNTYKVAAIYDGNLITRQIEIQNSLSNVSIEIESSDGTEFFNNMGSPTLECRTTGAIATSHRWGWSNNGGYIQQAADVIGIVNGNQLQQIQVFKIINYADFKCTVYDGSGYLGTGKITLTNEENDKANYLTIVNGTAVFKYTESGGAPNSDDLQNPQLIEPLTFELRDPTGTVIDPSTVATSPNGYIKWTIPKNNTLLIDQNNTGDISTEDDPYHIYENVTTLSYNIAKTFNYNKTNNQIGLQINYNGIMAYAQTRFLFTKQGDIGTNGTEYTVRLALNTGMSIPPQYPMITKIQGGNYIINYGIGSSTATSELMSSVTNVKLFKPELWRSGECVWRDGVSFDGVTNPTVEWSILANKYSFSYSDDTDFSINDPTTGEISYIDTLGSSPNIAKACIIKCALTYEGKTYYGTIPITTAWVSSSAYSINLRQGTGFRYVIYTADGMSPQYDNTNPFTIDVTGIDGSSYTFSIIGGVKNASTGAFIANNPAHLTELTTNPELPSNQKKYKPIGRYDGECVNNTLVCTYGSYAKIRIPIHFLLNRFGQANINAWDGNSVQIDSNGGFILAPQMGAGVKDNNNRFTGVLMGKVREAGKNNYNTGLFGYASGARTFFLNSQNGSAIFGNKESSQIIIDPASNNARLYSGNFWKSSNYDAQTGLPRSYSDSQYGDAGALIDFTTPQIVFKDKNFWIQSDGSIKANRIPQYENNQIKRDSNGQIIYQNKWGFEINSQTGAINSGYNINIDDYNFKIDDNGNVIFIGDLKAGRINSNRYNFFVNNSATGINPLLQAGWDSTNNKYNFVITADGDVTMAGDITANSGHIGGSNGWTIGYNDDTSQGDIKRGYIYSGSKRNLDSSNYGIYIGTDGISVANVFKVSADGRTIQIDAKAIILSKDTPITWGNGNSTDLQELVEGIVNGNGVPNYINHTFINGKKILSPSIYGGQFYATGIGSASGAVGNKNPAYYISDGVTGNGANMVPNQPIASLSYDTVTTDSDTNASTRVFLQVFNKNNESHALKLLNDGGNISIESLCIDQGSLVNPPIGNGSLYLKGQKKIHLTGPLVLEQLSTATSSIAEAYRGHYGTQLPDYGLTTYTPHLGRVFFKLT